jgi:hypothetical protein
VSVLAWTHERWPSKKPFLRCCTQPDPPFSRASRISRPGQQIHAKPWLNPDNFASRVGRENGCTRKYHGQYGSGLQKHRIIVYTATGQKAKPKVHLSTENTVTAAVRRQVQRGIGDALLGQRHLWLVETPHSVCDGLANGVGCLGHGAWQEALVVFVSCPSSAGACSAAGLFHLALL